MGVSQLTLYIEQKELDATRVGETAYCGVANRRVYNLIKLPNL